MDTILVNMSPQKRTVAFRIGLVVVASTTKGSIRSNDPDVVTLAKGVFGQFSPESRNPDVLMQRVQEAVSMDESTCKSLAGQMTLQEQNALKILLGSIYHDLAVRALAAGSILMEYGFAPVQGVMADGPKQTPELGENSFVEITDVAAVRGDSTELFNVFSGDNPNLTGYETPSKLAGNYDAWIEAGLCPTEGMVGIVGKVVDSPEGKLYFIFVEDLMVIPMLDFGIDTIPYGAFLRFEGNNQFHAYDPDGVRCRELQSSPRVVKPKVKKKVAPGTATMYFISNILRRFEKGVKVSDSYRKRLVILEYSENGRHLDLTVHGSMQTKHAEIVEDDGTVLRYRDIDMPNLGRFEVETGPDNETVRVSVFKGSTEYQYHI